MKILAIETSCDETAAAVVEGPPRPASERVEAGGTKVISNVVASSLSLHAKTGGIIPEMAAREQIKSIIPVIQEALANSQQSTDLSNKKAVDGSRSAVSNIDAIAVTVGPGLIGSLLVGVETAKTLAYLWNKPIIPVNHLVAHIYANWLNQQTANRLQTTEVKKAVDSSQLAVNLPQFPALALVVSGGHTDLVLMKDHGKIEKVAGTRDDAAGEAFDKCARLLGLPYPGGPSISAAAEKFLQSTNKLQFFPRPLIHEDTLDWSFSGLKTAVARKVKEQESKRVKVKTPQLAAEIQEAIVDVLVDKTLKAVEKYKPKSLLLSGGVAANNRLRKKLEHSVLSLQFPVKLFLPEKVFCTDNAAVIAAAAFYNQNKVSWKKIEADPEVTITS